MKSTHWSEAVKQAEAEGYARGLARGRQEGFAEARERAAYFVDFAPINLESTEEVARKIRALQPKGSGSDGNSQLERQKIDRGYP